MAAETADDDAGAASEAVVDPFKPQPPNLVQRFVSLPSPCFTRKWILSLSVMRPSLIKSGRLFAVWRTLEQYEIFKEYEELLDENLTEFVHKEGFKSVGACFNEISNLIEEDKAK